MRETKKRQEINGYKKLYQDRTYSQLNTEAIEVAFSIMNVSPNTWQQELKTNRKHAALLELMYEAKNAET